MNTRGRFKYLCDACKNEFFMQSKRLAYRCQPRCPACGSYSIDIKTKEAKVKRTLTEINIEDRRARQNEKRGLAAE